jgi:hypothetical protein
MVNMNIAKRIATLFGPLVVVAILAFVFLDDDPAHNHRDYVMGQAIGFGYVTYAGILVSAGARRTKVAIHLRCI